jgi:hypothetical protein
MQLFAVQLRPAVALASYAERALSVTCATVKANNAIDGAPRGPSPIMRDTGIVTRPLGRKRRKGAY